VSEIPGRISGLDPRDFVVQTGLKRADSLGPPAKMRPEHAKGSEGMQYWKGAEKLEKLPRRGSATLLSALHDVSQSNGLNDVGPDDRRAHAHQSTLETFLVEHLGVVVFGHARAVDFA
jgi:hypothetical protein